MSELDIFIAGIIETRLHPIKKKWWMRFWWMRFWWMGKSVDDNLVDRKLVDGSLGRWVSPLSAGQRALAHGRRPQDKKTRPD